MWLQLTLSMWLGGYEDEFTFGQHYKLIFPIAHIQTHVPTILKGASFIWPPPDCGAIRISSVALDQDSCKFKALYFKIHGNVGAAGSLQLKCPVLWLSSVWYYFSKLLSIIPLSSDVACCSELTCGGCAKMEGCATAYKAKSVNCFKTNLLLTQ